MKRKQSTSSVMSAFAVFKKLNSGNSSEKVEENPVEETNSPPEELVDNAESSAQGQSLPPKKRSYALKKAFKKKQKVANGTENESNGTLHELTTSNDVPHQIKVQQEQEAQPGPSTSKRKSGKPRKRKDRSSIGIQSTTPVPEVITLRDHTVDANEEIPCGNTEADKCISWLIDPMPRDAFFFKTFEKKPLHIKDRGRNYYKGIFSCSDFDKIMRNNHLKYDTNIRVVTYTNGEKKIVEADGRAYAAVIWDYYQNDHSIQFLNPQTYSKPLWKLCSLLQEFFGSFTGANMYLTPPGSQGFAPHYDDIEAFILQMEGCKQWKVYAPRSLSETLPRLSSRDFNEDEIGEPILDVELEPGDLLYFPRGFIHQAKTRDDMHSLHITVSTYQKNTWGDLLQLALPQAVQAAMDDNVEYRQSLPKDYMNYMGTACNGGQKYTAERHVFVQKLYQFMRGLTKHVLPDSCVDLMAKDYIHAALPPCLTHKEKMCSINENGERWIDGGVCNSLEIEPDMEIRLIRKRAVRLLLEEGNMKLYHCLENSRVFKEIEPQYVEIQFELVPAVEMLIESYPDYVAVSELPLNQDANMEIAGLLYDKGLIELKEHQSELDNDQETSIVV